jgi:hypothetical protein
LRERLSRRFFPTPQWDGWIRFCIAVRNCKNGRSKAEFTYLPCSDHSYFNKINDLSGFARKRFRKLCDGIVSQPLSRSELFAASHRRDMFAACSILFT